MYRENRRSRGGVDIQCLSARQIEVLELVAKGLTNEEIAAVLAISPTTVRTHVTALLARLELSNRTEAAVAYLSWAEVSAPGADRLDLPAIAVLPMVGVDGDPVTGAALRGLAHDLAALFARWCWFRVIAPAALIGASARESTGRPAQERVAGEASRAVARRLGATFLVDGSLTPTPHAWRLAVHVDDARSGHILWNERYEFAPEQLFAVQDTVCEAVVVSAYPLLIARARVGLSHRPVASLAAWELAYEGMRLQATREAAANAAAQARFTAALAREPGLVLAHYGLGLTSYDQVLNQWGPQDEARERLHECAQRCIALASHAAEGYYLLGRHAVASGDYPTAVLVLGMAIGRNPGFAPAHALLAQVLHLVGRSEEALPRMQHASRLDPRSFVAGLATLRFFRGEYVAALAAAEQAVALAPRYSFARVVAAASAWWAGDLPRARRHALALLELSPGFTLANFLGTFGPGYEGVERLTEALARIRAER